MKDYRGPITAALLGATFLMLTRSMSAQSPGPVAKWSFNETDKALTSDQVTGSNDQVGGYYKYVPGVSGTGLRFDGYTTSVTCKPQDAPKLSNAFSVEAWVALNTYPWNWVPIVDQEEATMAGYFFGIDAYGHLSLQVEINGVWQSVTSNAVLPLKRWVLVTGTFDKDKGLSLFLDGKPVGELTVQGSMTPAGRSTLLIGRVREPMFPGPPPTIHPQYKVWYGLDGILDELSIYDRSLNPAEIESSFMAAGAPKQDVLPYPKLPSGPPGAGPFGAYYATLKYQGIWDRLRRIGPDSDVVVRFDQAPIRLVFWQGTNYVPAWVTEDGKWYTDEFLETWGTGCPDGADCEPFSDKQSRYSHVSILESDPARAVVHWRYVLSEVEHGVGASPDPLTGWFDWADEYWTIYPDGMAVRKQVLWSSALGRPHEWQESIVIDPPGTRPEDNINSNAITVANMQGEQATYSWWPETPQNFPRPADPNIQIVNLKSQWKPFQIVSPVDSSIRPYRGPGFPSQYSHFHWRNHWPVAQIASSGRSAVAPDRAAQTSLSNIYWGVYSRSEDSMTKIMLDGLTTQPVADLVQAAKSWLSPPNVEVKGEEFRSEGYDPAQRAFVLDRAGTNPSSPLQLTLEAHANSPLYDSALVVKDWGEAGARLTIDGKPVAWGKDYRCGHVHRLRGTDLVVWFRIESTHPVRLSLSASE